MKHTLPFGALRYFIAQEASALPDSFFLELAKNNGRRHGLIATLDSVSQRNALACEKWTITTVSTTDAKELPEPPADLFDADDIAPLKAFAREYGHIAATTPFLLELTKSWEIRLAPKNKGQN